MRDVSSHYLLTSLLIVSSTNCDNQLENTFIGLLPQCRRGTLDECAATQKNSVHGNDIGERIHQYAISAILSAKELITQYQKVCEQVVARGQAVKTCSNWDEDCRMLQNIIQRQGEKTMAEVHHLLATHVEGSKERPQHELDHDLWSRFANTLGQEKQRRRMDSVQGWANTAKHARRAVRLLARDLPGESE